MLNSQAPESESRFPWLALAGLLLGVTLLRLVYLAWLCPYDLVGDEAHYWEWSRRLDWSYYSKGPGIAWAIAAGMKVFGNASFVSQEFGVRWLAPIFSMLAALCSSVLAWRISRDRLATMLTAILWLLVPAFQALALLMTIDGPMLAMTMLGILMAWLGVEQMSHSAQRDTGESQLLPFFLFALSGLMLGVGFLFKYVVILVVPGMLLFLLLMNCKQERDDKSANSVAMKSRLLAGVALLIIFATTCLPVLIWNIQNDWPTVRHLLGQVHLPGGDRGEGKGWSILHPLDFFGAQLGMVGPFLFVLLMLALIKVGWGWLRSGRGPSMADERAMHHQHSAGSPHALAELGNRFLFCLALPTILFYFILALFKKSEGNWAFAGYAPLIPLVAILLAPRLRDWKQRVMTWRALPKPRPKASLLRKQPESFYQVLWHGQVVVGVLTGLSMLFLTWLAFLPVVGEMVPLSRFTGQSKLAAQVDQFVDEVEQETGDRPIVIAGHYQTAGWLAFYMQGQPVVYSAQHQLGGRKSSYDFFTDTNLAKALTQSRDAILVKSKPEIWQQHFQWTKLETLAAPDPSNPIYYATDLQLKHGATTANDKE